MKNLSIFTAKKIDLPSEDCCIQPRPSKLNWSSKNPSFSIVLNTCHFSCAYPTRFSVEVLINSDVIWSNGLRLGMRNLGAEFVNSYSLFRRLDYKILQKRILKDRLNSVKFTVETIKRKYEPDIRHYNYNGFCRITVLQWRATLIEKSESYVQNSVLFTTIPYILIILGKLWIHIFFHPQQLNSRTG